MYFSDCGVELIVCDSHNSRLFDRFSSCFISAVMSRGAINSFSVVTHLFPL